jgi:hypothetical protein
MKKIFSLMTAVLLMAVAAIGQSPAPGLFNYQGVARNSVGNVLINKTISLRLTIHDGTPGGPSVYQETRTVTTNPFGLFNVQVGGPGASSSSGTIPGVNWGVNAKYIQVEIDPNGGSTFINIGTAQIASVPYALYSSLSNDLVLPFNKTQSDAGTLFKVTNSGTGAGSTALEGLTNSTAGNAYAVIGTVTSSSPGGFSTGVRGINNGTGGLGIGVWGSQNGSGWGVYGTAPSGIGGNFASTSGTGVQGSSSSGVGGRFTSTSGNALYTTGGVRLQGINEGANRVLTTIPGDGTATWQDPAAVGIVTGSGTLNFVPKWTPNGTNLGNSLLFDNGTRMGVGTTTPSHRFTVSHGGGTGLGVNSTAGFSVVDINAFNGDGALRFLNNGVSDWHIGNGSLGSPGGLDFWDLKAGLNRMMIQNGSGNVGINTNAPLGRLHVVSENTGISPDFYLDDNSNSGFNWSILSLRSTGTASKLAGIKFEGTASANSWMFFNEAGTFTNHLLFSTDNNGNTPDLSINKANSNVGIGRVNAGAKLHVDGSMNLIQALGSVNFGHQAFIANTSATATTSVSRAVIGYAANSSLENHGFFGYANGTGSSNNVGVFTLAATTTTGNNYGFYTNVSSGASNIGIQANVPGGANDWAGIFNGRVRIADGTEGAGRVFTSDASGNGSWQTAAGAGIVSGSGTLNYMPKWTPNGTTLGNSIVFDNGSSLNVNTTTPDNSTLLLTGGGAPALRIKNATSAGAFGGIYLGPFSNQDIYFGTNENAAMRFFTNTSERATISANGSLGVGNTSPVAKVEIGNVGTANNYIMPWGSPNPLGLNVDANAGAVNETSGILALADGAIIENNSIVAEAGTTASGNIGVLARVTNAPTGGGNSYAVLAYDVVNNPNTYAAWIYGKMWYQDGSQGAGKVLTSDANGVASWQGPVSISGEFLLADVPVASGADVTITNWATITNEDGGANYNTGTGEYTISASGYYDINASVNWLNYSTPGTRARLYVLVNGTRMTYETAEPSSGFGTLSVHYARRLNAGDVVKFEVNHSSPNTETLSSTAYGSTFDIHLVHR